MLNFRGKMKKKRVNQEGRMELKRVKVKDIIPYDKNPRKNDNAVDTVLKSIEQCGYCSPIVVDEELCVLAGHTRLKAQKTGKPVELCCAIGDNTIDGKPYSEIVEMARSYIANIGGFEKFAEWGLF